MRHVEAYMQAVNALALFQVRLASTTTRRSLSDAAC